LRDEFIGFDVRGEENYYNLQEFTPLPAASYQYPVS